MNPVDPIALATSRQRAAADPDVSAWVSASAGSGKTKVLVDRVLRLLLAGEAPQRILCLTFTKAAAAEMAYRLREVLALWAVLTDDGLHNALEKLQGAAPTPDNLSRARSLFTAVLDTPGGLHIETLHAFCQSLLARFPVEAGVAPGSEVLDERTAADMLQQALEDTLLDTDPEVASARQIIVAAMHETRMIGFLNSLLFHRSKLAAMLRTYGDRDGAAEALASVLGCSIGDTPTDVARNFCTHLAVDDLFAVARALGGKTGEKLTGWLNTPEPERVANFDKLCSVFLAKDGGSWRPKSAARFPGPRMERDHPHEAALCINMAERLSAVRTRMSAAVMLADSVAIWQFMGTVFARFEAAKAARAALDYDDLISRAGSVLSRTAWVMYKLDGGITHVLIDEAQDTSPAQWDIVRALTAEFFAGQSRHDEEADAGAPRSIFAVGDAKQSIYSFQGADPLGFDAARSEFGDRVQGAQQHWAPVELDVSFRSTAPVLQAVDATFAAAQAADGVIGPDHTPLAHQPSRTAQGGRVELWPPVIPAQAEEPEPWSPPADGLMIRSARARLASLIARKIDVLIQSGTSVASDGGRPLTGGDILVLVRQRNSFVTDLVRELKALNVPVAGVDRMKLADQIAVMDLIALARFLLLPEDDLTLATVLRGPLCEISEDDLFDLAYGRGKASLWARLSAHAGADSRIGVAHGFLESLLAQTDFITPHDLFARVLGPLGGRAKLLARLGIEAEDPISEFIALTLDYESLHPPSLQGFVHWLDGAAQSEIKRDQEHGDGQSVRIMTVHGAKGLQAPVVILPDTLSLPRKETDLLWHKGPKGNELLAWRSDAELRPPAHVDAVEKRYADQLREERRLLYVAMTRAEDHLIVCGALNRRQKEPPPESWYAMVRQGLESLGDQCAQIDDGFLMSEGETDGHTVHVLEDTDRSAISTSDAPHEHMTMPPIPEWAITPAPAEPEDAKPLTPSRLAKRDPAAASPLTRSDDGIDYLLRGTLIHRLLQILPDLPAPARKQAASTYLARAARTLTEAARHEMAQETLRLLDHTDMAALFAVGSRAEVSLAGQITLPTGGTYRVAGQIDRLAVSGTEVILADYKTNRPPPDHLDQVPAAYVAQMAAYRALLAQIYPGRAIRAVLVFTATARLLEIPAHVLDHADLTPA